MNDRCLTSFPLPKLVFKKASARFYVAMGTIDVTVYFFFMIQIVDLSFAANFCNHERDALLEYGAHYDRYNHYIL